MSNVVKIVVIILALGGGVGLIVMNMTKEQPGSLEGRSVNHYICADPACAEEFSVAPGESLAPPDSLTEVCPKCSKDYPYPAAKCSACGRLHATTGHGIVAKDCPHCGVAMPELRERLADG